LGLLLSRAGRRTRAFIGGDDAECHWGTTLGGMIKIMEKNYFAAADYRTPVALAIGLVGTALGCVVIAGWISGTLLGLAAGLAPCLMLLPALVVARRLGWSFASAALTPFIYPVLIYAMLNSMV